MLAGAEELQVPLGKVEGGKGGSKTTSCSHQRATSGSPENIMEESEGHERLS